MLIFRASVTCGSSRKTQRHADDHARDWRRRERHSLCQALRYYSGDVLTSKAKIRRARLGKGGGCAPACFSPFFYWTTFHHYLGAWNRLGEARRDKRETTRKVKENGLSRSRDFLAWKLKCWQARQMKSDLRVCLNNRGFPTFLFWKAQLMQCIELESILN